MCGVFGIIGEDNIADSLYHGLIKLQNRGQDSSGIFGYHHKSGSIFLHKERGLVAHVFDPAKIRLPEITCGIGHVRYTTIGHGSLEDTQPQCVTINQHTVAMAHNGNIVNYTSLKKTLEEDLFNIETSCDIEVILKIFAKNLPDGPLNFDGICHAVKKVFDQVNGAFSVVCVAVGEGMVAFRDPKGIRPLLYGSTDNGRVHAFASETEALTYSGFSKIHAVNPGEVIYIDQHLAAHRRQLSRLSHTHCSFEYVYFANTNSVLEGQEVYTVRSKLGKALAKKVKDKGIHADVVVPVPETARPAAIALARELGIPYEEGLIKKDHVGRTFIMPNQKTREKMLSRKIATVGSVFQGKSVIFVDDSVVRGTVCKKVIRLARKAGAKQVYFTSTFPPIQHPCFYGIDFYTREQLIAWKKLPEEIASDIGADAIIYNDIEGLREAIGLNGLCTACLTGNYPTEIHEAAAFQNLRLEQMCQAEAACRS